jgi:hypothetical protein
MGFKVAITFLFLAVIAVARFGKGRLPARLGLVLYVGSAAIAVLFGIGGAPYTAAYMLALGAILYFVLTGAWHPFELRRKAKLKNEAQ